MKLNEEIIEFLEDNPAEIATVDDDGNPNVTPKGSLQAIDEETIVYAEMYPDGKTAENIKENSKVAVSVVDYSEQKAYMIRGEASLVNEGEVYDKVVESVKEAPMDLPKPDFAGKIKVKKIIDHSAGPEAGKEI